MTTIDKEGNDETSHKRSEEKKGKSKKSKHKSKSKSSKSKPKKSDVDPFGQVTPKGDTLQYYNEERNPLTVASASVRQLSKSGPSGRSSGFGDSSTGYLLEECELLNDTFSFLMVARYPYDFIWDPPPKSIYDIDIGEESDDDSEIERQLTRLERANSDFMCLPFWVGFFVNMCQLFIYTVLMTNVFFTSKLPPNADRMLRLAQIFAVVITLYTQSDFIDGIFLLTETWKPFQDITTPIKFNVSATTRIFTGMVGIVTTFILIIYSTEVVDLLLNFTAIEFVATLDGSAYEVSAKGFLGVTLEKKCLEIQEYRYQRHVKRGSLTRLFAYGSCVALVIVSYIVVFSLQTSRTVVVSNEVYVQFDDTSLPDLFGITGVYTGCKGYRTKTTGDIAYLDISMGGNDCPGLGDDKEFPSGIFVYCWKLDGWAFVAEPTTEPCKSPLMRSYLEEGAVNSDSFDILTHSKANWILRRSDIGGETLLDFVFIEGLNSYKNTFKACDGAGLFPTHFSHVKREFQPLPDNHTYYPFYNDESFINIFGLIYRPIFQKKILTQQMKYQVVLFDGLRWHWINLNPSEYARNITRTNECDENDEDCWKVFVKYFHSETVWMFNEEVAQLLAISKTMKFLTPEDTGVPTADLIWYEPIVAKNRIALGKQFDAPDEEEDDDFGISEESFDVGDGVFGFQCSPFVTACAIDEAPLTIRLKTDIYPQETQLWAFYGNDLNSIKNLQTHTSTYSSTRQRIAITKDSLTILEFDSSDTKYDISSCVPKAENACVQLILVDTFGDGIYQAPYEFFYDGKVFESGSTSDFSCLPYQFGPGCKGNQTKSGENPVECVLEQLYAKFPGRLVTDDDFPFFDDDFLSEFDPEQTLIPISDDSIFDDNFFYDIPTASPIVFPTAAPIDCGQDDVALTIRLYTDSCISETRLLAFFGQGISVNDIGNVQDSVVYSADRDQTFTLLENSGALFTFEEARSLYSIQSCIPRNLGQCLQIVLIDTFGDGIYSQGIEIVYDEEYVSMSNFNSCRSFQFGSDCMQTTSEEECNASEIMAYYPGFLLI